MPAHQNTKRRHHHVWQHYLKPWTKNGAIWCQQDNKIFSTGTTTVAIENDFYKVAELSISQIEYLKLIFTMKDDKELTKIHYDFIDKIQAPFQFIKKINAPLEKTGSVLKHYSSNVLEDYHASIENSFSQHLKDALNKNIKFYLTDESCITFINYICTQYMRTKGIKERAIQANAAANLPDLAPMWNMMIHMFAINIGKSLFTERKSEN
ncbi:DUF4238 domain-containing protein [Aquitalea sp. LB_tupeE]|uniref:DUF4238 domain-containing protein n=1 Tax=Aquitalea sp. LB_tupeE TaxID=2748078 RepID=UPI0015BF5615|nr:DUF4238 domain-containing protein [Aquitalea sp. LB_tupeE]NWK78152.1 DUF4238 domain-containing protein [Aquitalea sp. LB_tupeE]